MQEGSAVGLLPWETTLCRVCDKNLDEVKIEIKERQGLDFELVGNCKTKNM